MFWVSCWYLTFSLANELNATSMTSLWVAAAATADYEDPFNGSEEEMSDTGVEDAEGIASSFASRYSAMESPIQHRSQTPLGSLGPLSPKRSAVQLLTAAYSGSRRPSRSVMGLGGGRRTSFGSPPSVGTDRWMSTSGPILPAIYANTGLKTPPALLETPQPTPPAQVIGDPFSENLAPIAESRAAAEPNEVPEKAESQWSLLPVFIIFQYFILAIHTTSHDQVFLMYLTSYVCLSPRVPCL